MPLHDFSRYVLPTPYRIASLDFCDSCARASEPALARTTIYDFPAGCNIPVGEGERDLCAGCLSSLYRRLTLQQLLGPFARERVFLYVKYGVSTMPAGCWSGGTTDDDPPSRLGAEKPRSQPRPSPVAGGERLFARSPFRQHDHSTPLFKDVEQGRHRFVKHCVVGIV